MPYFIHKGEFEMRKIISVIFIVLSLVFISGCSNKDKQLYNDSKKLILAELNDPDSYKMEYYNVLDDDFIKIKFRTKNEFNAMKIHYAYCGIEKYKDKSKNKLVVLGIYDKENDIEEAIIQDAISKDKSRVKRYTE